MSVHFRPLLIYVELYQGTVFIFFLLCDKKKLKWNRWESLSAFFVCVLYMYILIACKLVYYHNRASFPNWCDELTANESLIEIGHCCREDP